MSYVDDLAAFLPALTEAAYVKKQAESGKKIRIFSPKPAGLFHRSQESEIQPRLTAFTQTGCRS
jgi:hypothetical protein